ncbi:MAG: SDR family oxidoreductase [Anaerolineales bacterium]
MNILVAGASGYIGGRLVPRLVAAGHHVICLVRNPERLKGQSWENVEIRQGNLLDPDSLHGVMQGAEVAYYLVHSMADGARGFDVRDHIAAENFGATAKAASVQRIIYLGGLGECDKGISPHLNSRQHVGDVLRASGIPVTELRAAIVIGSGSMSFEMIRYITERLPIIFTPKWVDTLCQPIAIENVLDYLTESLIEPRSIGEIFEIGGPDVLTYGDIMLAFARARGLKRRLVPLPLLTSQLSAYGADILTPLPISYIQVLIEGLKSEVVVRDQSAHKLFNVKLIPYATALQQALQRTGQGEVETYWRGEKAGLLPGRTHKVIEGMFIEQRRLETVAEPEAVYNTLVGIGGKGGWYFADWLWQVRGLLDRFAGGPGMRRGRRSQVEMQPGEVLDGYRVETVEAGHLIRLRNEMKAPGPAWMQFEVNPRGGGGSIYIQTAFFEPHGLAGLAYWYGLYPFHQLIFDGLARAIIKRAEAVGEGGIERFESG